MSNPQIEPGPRILKEVGSPDWCLQTLDMLKLALANVEQTWVEADKRVGELESVEAWKVLGYRSFDAMCAERVGMPARVVRSHIDHERKLHDHGGARTVTEAKDQATIGSLIHGNTTSYTVARLKKKERQDLVDRVIAGEMSPNAAAIEAGFRHPMINVRADDPVAAVRALLRRYTAQEIQAAIEQMR